jgi:nucleotide-binding universal stress UspA family protein
VIGSVAERVLRMAPPMLLVGRPLPGGAAPRRVLLVLDTGPGSLRAAGAGLELAARLGAEVAALHVVEPPGALVRVEERLTGHGTDEERTHRLGAARQAFERWLAGVPGAGEGVQVRVVEGGLPQSVEAEAASYGAGLLVLGTHERSRAEELVVGSTARAVTSVTSLPVLLVRDRPPG